MKKRISIVVFCFCLVFAYTYADDDVMLFLVSYVVDECNLASTADHTSTFQGYMDQMEDDNWDVTDFNDSNYHVKRTMTDCEIEVYGRDHANLEPFDIGLFEGHGMFNDYKIGNYFEYRFSGNRYRGSDCHVFPRTEMHLGGTRCGVTSDLEFLHMHSCHSMTTNDDSHKHTWRPVFHGAHIITGFHGETDVNMHAEYESFAIDAQDSAVAVQWVANMYEYHAYNTEVSPGVYFFWDRCPMSYLAGTSEASMTSRLYNESYGNREYYVDVASPTMYKSYYVEDCIGLSAGYIYW